MPSIITIDKNWVEGIEKYLTLGATVLSSGNIPVAAAIATTNMLFNVWKKSKKKDLLSQKNKIDAEKGLTNHIIPIEERKKPEITEIFEQHPPEIPKKKKKRKKRKKRAKHKPIEEESRLKITIKTKNNMLDIEL